MAKSRRSRADALAIVDHLVDLSAKQAAKNLVRARHTIRKACRVAAAAALPRKIQEVLAWVDHLDSTDILSRENRLLVDRLMEEAGAAPLTGDPRGGGMLREFGLAAQGLAALHRLHYLLARGKTALAMTRAEQVFNHIERGRWHERESVSQGRSEQFVGGLLRRQEWHLHSLALELMAHGEALATRAALLSLGASLTRKGRLLREEWVAERSLTGTRAARWHRMQASRRHAQLSLALTDSDRAVSATMKARAPQFEVDAREGGLGAIERGTVGAAPGARELLFQGALSADARHLRTVSGRIAPLFAWLSAFPEAAIVEYVCFNRLGEAEGRRSSPWLGEHCIAIVLPGGGARMPRLVDLGSLDVIAQAGEDARGAIGDHFLLRGWRAPLAALHRRAIAPVLEALPRRTRHLYVVPDGDLHLWPLAATVDSRGRYFCDRYRLSFLSTATDVLDFMEALAHPPRTAVEVIADPDVETAQSGPEAGLPESAPATRDSPVWDLAPLPGARREAAAIRRCFRRARVQIGARASEEHFLWLAAPGILHVASHGFFLDGKGDPLVRSALVFAGASAKWREPVDLDRPDGIATALECAAMNLRGTQLVVLSACHSAEGMGQAGEGVHGLRRAIFVAGAETLVASLWKVDDQATAELMGEYYRRLARGERRDEALWSAARWLRDQPAAAAPTGQHYSHPHFWAAFVPIGNPDALRGFRRRAR